MGAIDKNFFFFFPSLPGQVWRACINQHKMLTIATPLCRCSKTVDQNARGGKLTIVRMYCAAAGGDAFAAQWLGGDARRRCAGQGGYATWCVGRAPG